MFAGLRSPQNLSRAGGNGIGANVQPTRARWPSRPLGGDGVIRLTRHAANGTARP
jgi:hypothetical protein